MSGLYVESAVKKRVLEKTEKKSWKTTVKDGKKRKEEKPTLEDTPPGLQVTGHTPSAVCVFAEE